MPVTRGSGNPKWTRDETILALDLYLRLGRAPGPNHPEVIALSDLLNRMPWHSSDSRKGTFRNPDGVSLKLLNMRSFERGSGLSYSKLDAEILTELKAEPQRVAELANTIRKAIYFDERERRNLATITDTDETAFEFAEGRLLTAIHLRRERSPKVRTALILHRKKAGKLACDLCSWVCHSSSETFHEAAFEAHHLVPLAFLMDGRKTTINDMALLCANCHRLIHRAITTERRWLSILEARSILNLAVSVR